MQALPFIGCRPARRLAYVLAITVAAAALAACGASGQPESVDPTAARGAAVQPTAAATTAPDSSGHSESQSATAAGEPIIINLDIANRAVALTRQDLQAKRGDTVSLRITSDEPGEIHLHGYNLTAAVSPESPGELTFRADTAGAFGVNFHAFAPAPAAATDAGGGGGPSAMSHGPIESEVPVSVGITAAADEHDGVNVRINADTWRWAPENVNGANIAGEGHAHIYVNGAKINRVYGPDYHIKNLPPGEHRIRVTLNANGHNALLVDGEPVEAATTVTVAEHGHTHDAQPEPVAAAPMAVDIMVNADPDGGYNLQVVPTGFAFAGGSVNQPFVTGVWEGHAYVEIDGNNHARLYEPWLKLPALEPGEHTIAVSLAANDRRPYHRNGQAVADSVTVNVAAASNGDTGGDAGHSSHGDGHGDAHSHGDAHGHNAGDDSSNMEMEREIVAEVHLGNLEIYP